MRNKSIAILLNALFTRIAMDFGMLIEVKTELIQGSIDLNIIGTDSHRAPPVSFLIASFYHASVGGAM